MNIAYVCADEGVDVFGDSGSGSYIRGSIRGLRERGHRVVLFFQKEPRAYEEGAADALLRVPLRPIGAKVRGRLRSAPGLRWINRLTALHSIEQVAYNRHLSAALEEWHRQTRFDLIIERGSLWHNAGLRTAKARNIPHILEVHSPEADQRRLLRRTFLWRAGRKMELHSWRDADIVAPVSSELAELLSQHGVPRDKMLSLPCAVSPADFRDVGDRGDTRRRLGIPEDRFLIGFASSFKPWHGTELLPAILRRLRDDGPRPHLLLVGDGPLRGALIGALERLGLAGYYTWTGPVRHSTVPSLLLSLDTALLLNASPAFSYLLPIKLLEYMAAGLPVVASRLRPHLQVVEDEGTALLAAAGDAEDFVRQLIRIRNNPSWASNMGRRARARVLAEYTWQKNAEKIEERLARTFKNEVNSQAVMK